MPVPASDPGFLIMDEKLNLLAGNDEAIQILAFPNLPERIKRLNLFLEKRIRSGLLDRQFTESFEFVKAYKSGKRNYTCRVFWLDCSAKASSRLAVAILERSSAGMATLNELSNQFDLTPRERQTVQFLVQGLTSKEIAKRMNISPNTVKAFLRIVMVKLGVSTRSGIVGRVVGRDSNLDRIA
jgi:DNA-binding CsgD family transcriptional regulator